MREGWTEATLGELCTLTKGASPTLKTPPGDYPLIVTGPNPLSSNDFQFDGEAVCIPMVSSTGHGHASLKRVHYASGKFAVANIITAAQVRNPDEALTRFLWLYLQHYRDDLIVTRMKGTANVSLSQKALATVPLQLPPLDEQRRIVDLIGAVDDAIEAAEETVAGMANFDASVCADAFHGYKSAGTRPLADLARTRLGKMLSASVDANGQPAPYLRNADVQWGRIRLSSLKTMPFSGADKTEFSLKAGDLLVCEGGEIGRAAVLEEDLEGIYFQKALHRVRCGESLDPNFLQAYLGFLSTTGGLADFSGSSTIPHLTGEKLRRLPIPDVSLEEQQQLVRVLRGVRSAKLEGAEYADSLRNVRSNLLTALLFGTHEIPSTYDEVMTTAA